MLLICYPCIVPQQTLIWIVSSSSGRNQAQESSGRSLAKALSRAAVPVSLPIRLPLLESNSLGITPHITAHRVIPEVILRTGGSIGPLGENHHLLRERILIKPGCGGKKGRPPLVAASQPGGHLFVHLCIALQFTWHKANLLSSIMELKKATQRSLQTEDKARRHLVGFVFFFLIGSIKNGIIRQ